MQTKAEQNLRVGSKTMETNRQRQMVQRRTKPKERQQRKAEEKGATWMRSDERKMEAGQIYKEEQ